MKNMKAGLIADTAIAVALCSLLVIICIYVPFFAVIGFLIGGTPLMYLACKRGVLSTIFAVFLTFFVLIILTGSSLTAVVATVSYILPAFAFSAGAAKKADTFTLIFSTAIAVLIGLLAELLIISGGIDGVQSFISNMSATMSEMLDESLKAVANEIPDNTINMLKQMIDESVKSFMNFLPAIFIIAALIYGYVISMFGVYFLKRFKFELKYIKFYEFKASRFVCNMTMLLYLISLFSSHETTFGLAIKNMVLVSAAILSVCGFSVIDYYLRKKISKGIVRFLIYITGFGVFVGAIPFLFSVLPLIGYIDSLGIIKRELGENQYEKK